MMNNGLRNNPALFDDAAKTYDEEFSESYIGRALRPLVWKNIRPYLDNAPKAVLEINCGTGEDAMHIAAMGHTVTATDQSAEMIKVADRKKAHDNLYFEVLDFRNLPARFSASSFDVVFSNFGGLNCASSDELKQVLADITSLLKPGGLFIGVVMSTGCLWEKLYYNLKGDREKVGRRRMHTGADTTIGQRKFKTYYYSPKDIEQIKPAALNIIKTQPVGLFIPPTYLEHYFRNHHKQLRILSALEKGISHVTLLSNMADHFMIVMEKR